MPPSSGVIFIDLNLFDHPFHLVLLSSFIFLSCLFLTDVGSEQQITCTESQWGAFTGAFIIPCQVSIFRYYFVRCSIFLVLYYYASCYQTTLAYTTVTALAFVLFTFYHYNANFPPVGLRKGYFIIHISYHSKTSKNVFRMNHFYLAQDKYKTVTKIKYWQSQHCLDLETKWLLIRIKHY